MRENVLLLIEYDSLFLKLWDYLRSKNIECKDYIFESEDCDLIFMEGSYYEAGTAAFLENRRFRKQKIILMVAENKFSKSVSAIRLDHGAVDDVLIVPDFKSNRPWEVISGSRGRIPLENYVRQTALEMRRIRERLLRRAI